MAYANRSSIGNIIKTQGTEAKTGFVCDYVVDFLHCDTPFDTHNTVGYSKASMPCYDIYFKEIGLIPNYGGHVPGAKFKNGQTFGNISTDAKSYMRLPKF